MGPIPSEVKVPVRARGVARKPPVKDSPAVTKAYWPFKSASVYLPTGGGGTAMPLPPLQAALQRAATIVSAKKRRFIEHLAMLPFVLASSARRDSSKKPLCLGRGWLAFPFVPCAPQRRRSSPEAH